MARADLPFLMHHGSGVLLCNRIAKFFSIAIRLEFAVRPFNHSASHAQCCSARREICHLEFPTTPSCIRVHLANKCRASGRCVPPLSGVRERMAPQVGLEPTTL